MVVTGAGWADLGARFVASRRCVVAAVAAIACALFGGAPPAHAQAGDLLLPW